MSALTPLKFGVANDKGSPNTRFGVHRGIFARHGIDVTIERHYGGPELAARIDSGDIPIGEFGAPPILTAVGKGAGFKIIASGMRQKFLMYLGVHRRIENFAGLKGRTVGLLSRGSCDEWLAREMWAKNGLDPDADLSFYALEAEYPVLYDLMEAGKFDAVLAAEPTMALGESRDLINIWDAGFHEAYVPRYQWGMVVARPDFIAGNEELVSRFLAAHAEAARDAVNNPGDWAAFMAEQQETSTEVTSRAIMRERALYRTDGVLDLAGLSEAVSLQVRTGALSSPLAIEDITDLRFQPALKAA